MTCTLAIAYNKDISDSIFISHNRKGTYLYEKNNSFKLSDGRTIQSAIVDNTYLRNKGINSGSEFEQFVTKHGFEIDCCISAYTLPNPDIANGFYSVNLLKDNKDADTVLIYIYKVSGARNYTYVCFPYKSFSLTMSAQIADDFKNTICGFADDLDEFKKQLYMCFPVL